MPTLEEITGAYEGYTETDRLAEHGNYGFPTLYFKKGRLTQRHRNTANVGWHPHGEGVVCIRKNISLDDCNAYARLQADNNEAGKNAFKKRFRQGELTSHSAIAKLFELIGERSHISRSRLMRYGPDPENNNMRDSLFNMGYGAAYARTVLKQYEEVIRRG